MPASGASLHHDTTDPSIPHQQPLPTGPIGLTKQRPALAQLREAMTALHIGRTSRAVSYELMTYWSPGGTVFPSVKVLADGMGLKRRAVRHHIAHLERVGLWVRIEREDETNLYILHLPGEAQDGFDPRHTDADPPARTCRTPGTQMPVEVIKEVTKEVSAGRASCATCGRTWPSEYGTVCHACGDRPMAATTPAVGPNHYGRLRNCPKCHTFDRGHDDTCQSCDWTRAAWEEKQGGPFPRIGASSLWGGVHTSLRANA